MPVYFIRPVGMRGPVKIGCSELPINRLKTLMVWSPFKLEVAATVDGGFELERRLHSVFRATYSHGEWFGESAEMDNLIDKLNAGVPLGEIVDLTAPIIRFKPRDNSFLTPSYRHRASYKGRVRWAFAPFWKPDGEGLYEPHDVYHILARWTDQQPPTPEEFQRLEEVIANPTAHAVTWEKRWGDDEEEAA